MEYFTEILDPGVHRFQMDSEHLGECAQANVVFGLYICTGSCETQADQKIFPVEK